jgi:ABC-type branched-subunit amino acid transport system substrate-binding protein
MKWLLGSGLALFLAACGGTPRSTITLGGLLSQTGGLSTIGEEELRAAQLAIDEINAAGGVLGSDLVLHNEDEGSERQRVPLVAADLVSQNVPAIIGSIASGSTISTAAITIPSEVVLISGASTSPEITTLQDNDTVFRTCPSDTHQGALLAERALKSGFTSVGVLWIPDAYGMGLSQSFVQSFEAKGGTVPFSMMYTENQLSYMDLLTQAFAATPRPQAIVLVAYPVDGAQIVQDYLSAFSGQQTFWFFTNATEDTSFVSAVGPSNFTFKHEGTGPGMPGTPQSAAFANAFVVKYGVNADPGTYSANVYDAVYLIALAMQMGGKADSATLKTNLRAAADNSGMTIGPGQWAQALAAITSGAHVGYVQSSGSVGLDGNGDPVSASYSLWQVQGGAITAEPGQESVSP